MGGDNRPDPKIRVDFIELSAYIMEEKDEDGSL